MIKKLLGVDGIKNIYEQTLETKESLCGFTDFSAMEEVLGKDWMWKYAKRRAEVGIAFHCIAVRCPVAVVAEKRSEEDNRPMRFVDDIASGIELYVQGDKVFELNFVGNFGRVIEDAQLAKTVKAAWQRTWDSVSP